jgi:hypothetical protein
MKARVSFGLAAIFLVALLAAADDPWKGANYQNWDEKDVKKVLEASPWGRELVTRTTAQSSENKQKAANSTVNRYDTPEQLAAEWVQVVWWSSKTVRRAVLRKAMLKGAKFSEDQAKGFTESPLEDHVIVVWGDSKTLAGLARLEPADLKKVAYLDSPRLKMKIEPIDAGAERLGNTPPDKIFFKFPRTLNGADTVTAEDGRLVFKWRLVRNPKEKIDNAEMFEVVFSPNKMVSSGAADY